ncbi:ISSoc3, transposase [Streptomyces griseoflavus Tu4000]|uniref:ISSoc3, transposase n=1 Tax=Streptomyces griseoflavus Tu4000 TaxID=467200 RepID=D9XJA4_9ACTN|nr:ISSoc3, transposase [Streptomyces griseoflavus Tu4000]
MFDDEMLTRCEQIMRKVCEDFEAELKEFNGERDHVHLLVHYPPKVAVSKLVNSLKGVSARRIRLGAPPGRRLGESSPAGATAPSCMGTCGRPRISPHRAAEHRWRSSASTSSSKNLRSEVHVRAVLRCIHPRREHRGFLQESR